MTISSSSPYKQKHFRFIIFTLPLTYEPVDMYTVPHGSDCTYSAPYDDVFPSASPVQVLPPVPKHAAVLADHHYHHHRQQLAEMEFSSLNMGAHSSSSTSGCSGYDSPGHTTSDLIQRSTISRHSFQKNKNNHRCLSADDYHDMDTSSPAVRRVFSTDGSPPLESESTASIIIEAMNRACPYTPEEKKERIERYRSKRTQRNFSKRIKYACRKTLADSRPRIRGRFARNDEIEKNPEALDQWNLGDQDSYSYDEDDENWINYLDSVSSIII